MKKIYSNFLLGILCAIALTSCNARYKFVTQNLPENESSYLITKSGKRVDAIDIVVRQRSLKVDNQDYALDDLAAIKSKKMYFVVDDNELYLGEIYGKINMLYKLEYGSTSTTTQNAGGAMQTTTTPRVVKIYYLQKQGSGDIDKLTKGVLFEYLSDNEKALSKAKGSYAWKYVSYVGAAGFAAGVIWSGVILVQTATGSGSTPSLGTPLLLAAGSIPVNSIAAGISDHKLKKSILIYNNTK